MNKNIRYETWYSWDVILRATYFATNATRSVVRDAIWKTATAYTITDAVIDFLKDI